MINRVPKVFVTSSSPLMLSVFAPVPVGYSYTTVDFCVVRFPSQPKTPMKRKKDLRNSFLISGGAVEIYEFLEISLKNRMDRCQLVSVNITFSIVDGHFGEIFSHAVTTGKFTFLALTTLFTLIEHETSFLVSHWT